MVQYFFVRCNKPHQVSLHPPLFSHTRSLISANHASLAHPLNVSAMGVSGGLTKLDLCLQSGLLRCVSTLWVRQMYEVWIPR